MKEVELRMQEPSSQPFQEPPSSPVNEEPEQEYDERDGSGQRVVPVQVTGNWENLDAIKPWEPQKAASGKPPRMDHDVSCAELADSRQRLQNIGKAARRIPSSLGGSAAAA